jgi:DNA polymerase III sliding clamp (beta) subunit (PCNA family)
MAISQAKKLEIITKHGRKFTSKSASTPILEGVHYAADGSIVTTDRHKLLRIGGAHNFAEPFTSHVVTGSPIDGTYPDTSKIIPQELNTHITLINGYNRDDVKDAIARVKLAVEAAKVTGDKSYIATVRKSADSVTLSVGSAVEIVALVVSISADTFGPDDIVSFNAEYMLAALNVFKDAGSKRVIIGLTGALTPIVLRDEENEIDVVVLPCRRPA